MQSNLNQRIFPSMTGLLHASNAPVSFSLTKDKLLRRDITTAAAAPGAGDIEIRIGAGVTLEQAVRAATLLRAYIATRPGKK